jgi:predicted nuclease with TOPRIM domain
MATTSFTFNTMPAQAMFKQMEKKVPVKKTNELSRADLELRLKEKEYEINHLMEQHDTLTSEVRKLREKIHAFSSNPSLEDIQQNLTGLFFQMKLKEKVKVTDKASVQKYFDILWDAIKRDRDEPLAE